MKTVMLTWKMQMSITLLITHAFVNFLSVHDTEHLKFRVQKFESFSVFRIEEYIAQKISAFKSKFCNTCVHIKMNKMPRKNLEKSNFVLEKSGKHSQISVTNSGSSCNESEGERSNTANQRTISHELSPSKAVTERLRSPVCL